MKYRIEEWPIKRLNDFLSAGAINLQPPYQRNDIWLPVAKKRLLETIHQGLPLPNFFLHEIESGTRYDMVDGQQRTRTIVGYLNGVLKDETGEKYSPERDSGFLDYALAVIVICDIPENDPLIRDFYYRVNKFGTKVNRPETIRSKYLNTPLQNLVEEIATSEKWTSLNLFPNVRIDRLADEDFIAELLTLQRFNITDKKLQVDTFYQNEEFSEADALLLKSEFEAVIDKIVLLNGLKPLAETRYRQRNDFYTLYNFIKTTTQLSNSDLAVMYDVLVRIGPSITPSREESYALQDYAINCVSQSHLKSAREKRQAFFTAILLNEETQPVQEAPIEDRNPLLADVMRYFGLTNDDLIRVNQYYTMNPMRLPQTQQSK